MKKRNLMIKSFCKRSLAVITSFALTVGVLPALSVKAAGTTDVLLSKGETYAVLSDTELSVTDEPDTSVATVSKGTVIVDVTAPLYDHNSSSATNQGVDANFGSSATNRALSSVEFTFTRSGDNWQIYNGDGSTKKYLRVDFANRYFGTSAADMNVEKVTADDGTVTFVLRRPNERYVLFLKEPLLFDAATAITNSSWKSGMTLFERKTEVAEEDLIPGYQKVSELKDGGSYLITYLYDDNNIMVLYPENTQASQTKLYKKTDKESVSVSSRYSLKIYGFDYGTTTITAGETTYNVKVLDKFNKSDILVENAKANSEQNPPRNDNDGYASWAFDGNNTHWWHSRYQDTPLEGEVASGVPGINNPIWIQTAFNKAWMVKELHYVPRGTGDNAIGDYQVKIANMANPYAEPQDSDWVVVATGSFTDARNGGTVILTEYTEATHIRLVALTKIGGGSNQVTAKNISFYGKPSTSAEEKSGIVISTLPTKKVYCSGQNIDLNGIQLSYVYNTGRIEAISDINIDDISVSADINTVGKKNVTVSYGGYSATYPIIVVEETDYIGNLTIASGSQYTGTGENGNGPINNAFDFEESTYWHSGQGNNYADSLNNFWVTMTMDEATIVDGVRYKPRDASNNGYIVGYRIEGKITEDGEWFTLTEGKWGTVDDRNADWKLASFPAVRLKAVKFVATNTYGDRNIDKFANAAEIRIRTATAEESLVATSDDPDVITKGSNLALKGMIDMNYFVKLTDTAAKSNAKVRLDVAKADGTTASTEVAVKEAAIRNDNNNNYAAHVFTSSVAAKEMTESITATLCYAGKTEQIATSSVVDYVNQALNISSDDRLKALLKAMVNYGTASQKQFKYNLDNLAINAISDNTYSVPEIETIENHEFAMSDSIEGLDYYGSSLVLESETTLCHYFELTDDTANQSSYSYQLQEGVNNTVSAEIVTTEAGKRYLRVSIKGIAAADLDVDFQLTVTKTSGETNNAMTVKYAPLTYAKTVLAGNKSDTLKTLVKALYDYNEKANAYFTK